MKKYWIICLVGIFLISSGSIAVAEGDGSTRFNEKARVYNGWLGYYDEEPDGGWLPGTMDTWLLAKFSRDWAFQDPEASPVGAWCTMHFTWYSDDYSSETMYGWYTAENWTDKSREPEAEYMMNELVKFKKMSDDEEKWGEYMEEGALPASAFAEYIPEGSKDEGPEWMTAVYSNEVPKFIIIQDTIEVHDAGTGQIIAEINRVGVTPKGLGK